MSLRRKRTGGIAGEPLTRQTRQGYWRDRSVESGARSVLPRRDAGSGRRRVDGRRQGGQDGCLGHGSRRIRRWLLVILGQPQCHWQQDCTARLQADRLGYSVVGFAIVLRLPAAFHRVCATTFRGGLKPLWLAQTPVTTGGSICQPLPRNGTEPGEVHRDCRKLRKINHLQHTTDASHYRAMPVPRGAVLAVFFP